MPSKPLTDVLPTLTPEDRQILEDAGLLARSGTPGAGAPEDGEVTRAVYEPPQPAPWVTFPAASSGVGEPITAELLRETARRALRGIQASFSAPRTVDDLMALLREYEVLGYSLEDACLTVSMPVWVRLATEVNPSYPMVVKDRGREIRTYQGVSVLGDSRYGEGEWRLRLSNGKVMTNMAGGGDYVDLEPGDLKLSYPCPQCGHRYAVPTPLLASPAARSEDELLRERIALKLRERFTGQKEVLVEFVRWATARQGEAHKDKTKSIFYRPAEEVVAEFLAGPATQETPAPEEEAAEEGGSVPADLTLHLTFYEEGKRTVIPEVNVAILARVPEGSEIVTQTVSDDHEAGGIATLHVLRGKESHIFRARKAGWLFQDLSLGELLESRCVHTTVTSHEVGAVEVSIDLEMERDKFYR